MWKEGRFAIRVKKDMRQQKYLDRLDVASRGTDAEITFPSQLKYGEEPLKVCSDVLQPLTHWSSTLTRDMQQRHKAGAKLQHAHRRKHVVRMRQVMDMSCCGDKMF